IIFDYFNRDKKEAYPDSLSIDLHKKQDLRYGENPHQTAAFYGSKDLGVPCISNAEQLHGKALSFNNILDTDVAIEIVKEFDIPAAVLIKHANPCGVATAENLKDAFAKAYSTDTVSAFGCILSLNRRVDVATAEAITEPGHFVEAIAAPGFDDKAIEILTTKRGWGKDLRLLKLDSLGDTTKKKGIKDFRGVVGGVLVQDKDMNSGDKDQLKVVTKKAPTDDEIDELLFAWKVCKHAKSNAIIFTKDKMVIGVGAGQMSRVDSTNIAISKSGGRTAGTVMASDAFFPFPDCIDIAAKVGITAIIQPGGSKKDQDSIDVANEHGIAMVFTGERHFKH
ncbi:MAG TPA: bifunctional phosphoribosylaminoimidazolecarboxamide formyltransferase/IMP cyclohydrolase, partial [Candidatus Scalindua sp.]|nr:bifunctional phosphoribosylaminoimidazolecarboxamide formyltransferase/IMP cyclohydrolase [Candidatus Scalindua sp.]